MEAKYWFYIIVGGIYLLSRILKKNGNEESKSAPAKPQRTVHPQPSEKPKALTFEELLKEITEGKAAQKASQPQPQPIPRAYQEVDYDDDLKDEVDDLEEIGTRYPKENSVTRAYEEGKKSAFNRRSLEETLNVRNTDVRYAKFKVFEQAQERNLLEEYTSQFRDPEGLKKAVVMSEILNRKF